jgi:hypothetical protein
VQGASHWQRPRVTLRENCSSKCFEAIENPFAEETVMPVKKLIRYDIGDMLDFVRLERRRSLVQSILPALGFLALGLAVGGGAGLMLAPWSGRRLRQEVGGRIDQIRERMKNDRRNQGTLDATTQQG